MASSRFVHLHAHSEYSLLDSACKIPDLLDRAQECGMDALALTDHGVMSGVIKFYREAKKRGIKPIIGCEIYLAPGSRHDRNSQPGTRYYHLVLLAENETGYRNLIAIVSRAYTEGFYYKPRADKELLRQYHEGLIALSGCESGEVPRLLLAGREKKAREAAREYAEIFGDGNFYIELQDHGTARGKKLKEKLIALARDLSLPLVATNDIHYLTPDDRHAHEVLLNIRANKTLSDPDHRKFDGEGYHFRCEDEMTALFSDVPEALENTRVIADRCHLEIPFGKTMIPPFTLPDGESDPNAYLRKLAYQGAKERYGSVDGAVKERLEYELSVIERMNYATYFLIVWDFVRFAREQGIPVGPGRGSAAGSLVAYCVGITRVDPLKYNLIFERFLNPERISMPDFDIDFCVRGRDRVIQYVQEKYGVEKLSQIATYDRMAARSVVRDVGRVLGVPYSVTDRLAKLIPFGYQLKTAVEKVPELKTLYETDATVREIIDIGRRLEGLARNTSTHAAGVVIAPDALINHVPLLRLTDGAYVTQYDMIDVEAIGLLKFDFLGLRNLTLIDDTCCTLRARRGIEIDLDEIPLDDELTFALLRDGKTAGIFQLESSGMTGLIKRVQPDKFEDLIALLALYRPGPLESGMTDEYVERRHGRRPVTYPHPSLKDVLAETYGLPIYQDQLMLMAQKLAGFSLAEADILRKAMGKKKKEIMASLQEKFIEGCVKNGIPRDKATQTFAEMEKFSRYGFNKSHTTAYAFVSYWTAYLKAHYPTHFMASLLTSVQGDTDKVAEYIGECREMGIEVLPPDINESEHDFTPVAEGRIRFGLGAIKHVGSGAIERIISARGSGYKSFFDLCRRVDGDGVDREALEALIKAGAFDSLGHTRKGLLMHLSDGLELMQISRRERVSGQRSFFEELDTVPVDPDVSQDEFSQEEILAFERELLGLYVSAHPLDNHRDILANYAVPLSDLGSIAVGQEVIVGGRIRALRKIATKNGDPMAFVTLEDGRGELEATMFPRVLAEAGGLIEVDALVGLRISAGERNGEVNWVVEEAFPLVELPRRVRACVVINLTEEEVVPDRLQTLSRYLQDDHGDLPVLLRVQGKDGGSIDVLTAARFHVSGSEKLRTRLEGLLGAGRVTLRNGAKTG